MIAALLISVTLTLSATLLVTRLVRKTRASVRHLLLTASFAVLLILPAAAVVMPAFRAEVPIEAPENILSTVFMGTTESPDAVSSLSASIAAQETPHARWPSLSTFLIGAWLAGVAVFLTPVIVGLSQMRSLLRQGLPWRRGGELARQLALDAGLGRSIDVRLHESVAGPLTCGILRPTILLPIDGPQWPRDELYRALVHELEHVRRGDWLSQCLARGVAAAYWFHPIVWMTWRQLVLEAERACDDAVLGRCDTTSEADLEATSYAEQLVVLAQRLSTHTNQPQLAMASRRDLSARVIALLDRHQSRGRAGGITVAIIGAACVLLVATLSPLRIVARAQAPAGAAPAQNVGSPRYETAAIKPCQVEEVPTGARGTAGGTNATFSPGRFFVPCVTTEQLIYLAYASYGAGDSDRLVNDDPGSASNATKIRGGPAWVHSLKDKYSIEATAPGAAERTVLMGSMLRTLLEERFHLKIHRETEEVAMYELNVAKSGFKLTPMKDGDCEPDDGTGSRPDPAAAKPRCGTLYMTSSQPGLTRWSFGTGTMASLASQLSRTLGTHVIDRTGITDRFVFTFTFARESDVLNIESSGVSTALKDQLGLAISNIKAPREFIVIDAIERPKTN